MAVDLQNEDAVKYLSTLLGKTLRIQVTDTRLFTGQLKCTDRDQNIILANAHEYRQPSKAAVAAAAANTEPSNKFRLDMTSRFVGLIVIPGEHITKIEIEEYVGGKDF